MAKHLTVEQRFQLEALYKLGKSRREMAEFLGCSIRTIYYELARGRCKQLDWEWREYTAYSADVAQQEHDRRQSSKGPCIKLGSNWAFAQFVKAKIVSDHYSPRAVLAEIDAQHPEFNLHVSHSTLYDWIDKGYLGIKYNQLPEGRRKKRNGSQHRRPPRIVTKSIEKRPAVVAGRGCVGHWEMDTVIGKNAGKQDCLLVLTERRTKMELIYKLRSKSASETVRVINSLHRKLGRNFSRIFQTITCDNGSEFMDWKGIEKNNRTQVYYCHPYSSWERGQNENANRLIRRFIPKGESINNYSKAQVKQVAEWMNCYPRQALGWQRPIDLFTKELNNMGIDCSIIPKLL